jgi:hypothetical protein
LSTGCCGACTCRWRSCALGALLAIDNVEQRLAVSYRKSLVDELAASPHALAASVAADALVVLDAARGLVRRAAVCARWRGGAM